jgi:formate hydrogenlyase subunit 6/NADH:ubiquinone oxidoreductase subunit I
MAKKFQFPQIFKTAAAYILIKPVTTRYPFGKTSLLENLRGQPIFNRNLCIGCGACSKNCPSKAINMVKVNEKKYPQFNLGKCIFCNECVINCPKKAIINSSIFELATTDKSTLIINPEFAVLQ